MARLNIEDRFWKDDRFLILVEKIGRIRAAGAFLTAMKTAQNFWLQDKLIPRAIWDMNQLPESLFTVGLAEDCPVGKTLKGGRKMQPGIYVRGSEKQFAWLDAARANGRAGGRSKAEKTKNGKTNDSNHMGVAKGSIGSEINKPSESEITIKLNSNENAHLGLAASSGDLAAADLSSPSSLLLKKKTKTCSTARRTVACDFDLLAAYENYPRKQGKSAGIKTLAREIKTEFDYFDLLNAIERYNAHLKAARTEPKYFKMFSTFANEWRDWLEQDAGKTTAHKFQNQFELNSLAEIVAIEKQSLGGHK